MQRIKDILNEFLVKIYKTSDHHDVCFREFYFQITKRNYSLKTLGWLPRTLFLTNIIAFQNNQCRKYEKAFRILVKYICQKEIVRIFWEFTNYFSITDEIQDCMKRKYGTTNVNVVINKLIEDNGTDMYFDAIYDTYIHLGFLTSIENYLTIHEMWERYFDKRFLWIPPKLSI